MVRLLQTGHRLRSSPSSLAGGVQGKQVFLSFLDVLARGPSVGLLLDKVLKSGPDFFWWQVVDRPSGCFKGLSR